MILWGSWIQHQSSKREVVGSTLFQFVICAFLASITAWQSDSDEIKRDLHLDNTLFKHKDGMYLLVHFSLKNGKLLQSKKSDLHVHFVSHPYR